MLIAILRWLDYCFFLFEEGRVNWDEDLLINGHGCLETLVRVGMGIGQCHRFEE